RPSCSPWLRRRPSGESARRRCKNDPGWNRTGVAAMRWNTALLLLALSAAPSSAQDWPSRPVRIIVPFGAGGSGDTLARVVAEHLSATFKQQFVVENRTGSGGAIGAAAIASSA